MCVYVCYCVCTCTHDTCVSIIRTGCIVWLTSAPSIRPLVGPVGKSPLGALQTIIGSQQTMIGRTSAQDVACSALLGVTIGMDMHLFGRCTIRSMFKVDIHRWTSAVSCLVLMTMDCRLEGHHAHTSICIAAHSMVWHGTASQQSLAPSRVGLNKANNSLSLSNIYIYIYIYIYINKSLSPERARQKSYRSATHCEPLNDLFSALSGTFLLRCRYFFFLGGGGGH